MTLLKESQKYNKSSIDAIYHLNIQAFIYKKYFKII
jgi:hypothetical protein